MLRDLLAKLLPPNKEGVAVMPRIACDWCGRSREVDMRWSSYSSGAPGDILRGIFVCSSCNGRSPFELREETITFKPGRQLLTPLNDNVPEDVRERYVEARALAFPLQMRECVRAVA